MSNTRTVPKAETNGTPADARPVQEMSPHQALGVLDQATANVQLGRQDHMLVIQALQTLATLLGPPPA